MSKAEELLDNTDSGVMPLLADYETEPHIVIDANRNIVVPDELKRIAVQHDHMIETVTFDCPRYWDEHDMSKMYVYVNYMRSDGEKGSDLATNVIIDKTDSAIMHFDWTITGHLSAIEGNIVFLVCIQDKMAGDGTASAHWNSELNTDMYVSEGLEVESDISAVYPGIITQLLTRMDDVEAKTTDESLYGYVSNYVNNNPTKIKNMVDANMETNGTKYVGEVMETNQDVKDMVKSTVITHVNEELESYYGYTNVVSTYCGSDTTYPNNDLSTSVLGTSPKPGEIWLGISECLTVGSYGECVWEVKIPANHYIDFTNGVIPALADTYSYAGGAIVVKDSNPGYIFDVVKFGPDNMTYLCAEDCTLYYTTDRNLYADDTVVFQIRECIDFSKINDIDSMKQKISDNEQEITEIDRDIESIVLTYYTRDSAYSMKKLVVSDSAELGDIWNNMYSLSVTSAGNTYCVELPANHVIEFGEKFSLMSSVYAIDSEGYIIDIVSAQELSNTKTYSRREDCTLWFSHYSVGDRDTTPVCGVRNYRTGSEIEELHDSIEKDIDDVKTELINAKPILETFTVSEMEDSCKNHAHIFETGDIEVGDTFAYKELTEDYLETSTGYYACDIWTVSMGSCILDFTDGILPTNDPGMSMCVARRDGIYYEIVDIVDLDELYKTKTYSCPENALIVFTYKLEDCNNSDILYRIRECIDPTEMKDAINNAKSDITNIKSDMLPYIIDLDTVDKTDAAVGDAIIEAFLGNRNIVVETAELSQGADCEHTYWNVLLVAIPSSNRSIVYIGYYNPSSNTIKTVPFTCTTAK